MSKVWFITGASRGLGLQAAKAALAAGHKVAATARNKNKIPLEAGSNLLTLDLDITDTAQVIKAVEAATAHFGTIDVLLNNAGYGQLGWFENLSDNQIRRQFETNVFGTMAVTRAVLPQMRERRSGHIFTITSVAGLIAVAGSSIYGASKFAVEGFMEGLHAEVKPFGIAACAIEPGFFNTDFLDGSSVNYGEYDIADYAESSKAFREFHDGMNHNQLGDPAKLGTLLLRLAEMDETPVRLAAGSDAVEWVGKKGRELIANAEQWAEYSRSTDRENAQKADSLPKI